MSKKDWLCDYLKKKKKNMIQVYTTESEQTLAHPRGQSVLSYLQMVSTFSLFLPWPLDNPFPIPPKKRFFLAHVFRMGFLLQWSFY